MELKLEVVLSSSIKRKKPWPRFCWLGQEKESVFLLDDKRISEINMVSGRTKKRTPKLHHLLNSVVTMASSGNGLWLCGLLVSGELFLWNKDKDLLKTAAAVTEIAQTISQGNPSKFSVQVSGDAKRVLLVAKTGLVFLWECEDVKDLTGPRDGAVRGRWALIQPLESTVLPSSPDKDAAHHILFVKTEEVGDACLLAFVFTSGKKLIITFLKILWEEGQIREGSVAYRVHWATKTYPLSQLAPPCQAVKSRGALVPAFSPDGKLLAVVLNQRRPKATQILFVSTQNFVSLSSDLGGCGSNKLEIPSKYIRSYWVSSVSWSPGGLFLACVLKRGSLLMVARLGGLLTLTSSGCSVDFGPAQFLPLHPLVTYCPPISAGRSEASLSSSSLSVRDVLRQRYSVTWHRKLLYLIVSDGYMVTVLRVPDRPSPGLVLRALLKDISEDLSKASQKLDQSQIHAKTWLESLSYLNMDSSLEQLNPPVTAGPNTADLFASAATEGDTLPPFLQDQRELGGTKELFESFQAFFEEDSDVDGLPVGSHAEDGGRLEFASMFDTLHAQDTHPHALLITSPNNEEDFVQTERKTLLYCQLQRIQKRLLTAWAFAMSLGNAIEHRPRLLKHILCCVVRLSALLRWISSPAVTIEGSNNSPKLLHLIESLLSFLPWDSAPSDGPRCLGLMVEFSKHLIRILLTPHLDSRGASHCHLSSLSLSEALFVLQMLSDSLDWTYSLQQRTHWSSAEKEGPSEPLQLWLSDVHHVPLLQEEEEEISDCEVESRPAPRRPSSRLLGAYRLLYNIAQQYGDEVNGFAGCDGWEEEIQQLSVIMSHIQTAVQATGEQLEEGPGLLSYAGEHLFLSGSYSQSAHLWQLQICEENIKSHDRSAFQETRLCLALLYSLLSQYNLKEAQEMGDHMAQLVLYRAGHLKSCPTDSLPCPWLPVELGSDAACAVIQTLGRFMASYFTNQPLHILPPHNVAVLPPLHLPPDASFGRLVPLSQEEVARAVRQQHLSQVWTVDYAQDLLLLGGLLPEATWLAYNLGDWKTAVSLSLAYTSYCADHFNFTWLRRRELHLPAVLKPENIFEKELESLLYNTAGSNKCTDTEDDKSLTDLLDGEDWDLLRVSMQEILKASVIAGVNVISSPVSSLLDAAKALCASLPALVPTALYLPSPPLYCPQPSPNTQDQIRKMGQFAEVACRHKVSGVLQRLMLLLRSGHCCYPAVQWYISQLRRARHLLHKIKRKYPYPAEDEKSLPEGLMKLITRSGFFRRGPKKDGHLDPDTIQIIICFRELCALCWMLHVRDQLSISCRKYQAAREHSRDEEISSESEVTSTCVEALRWACRFLPFSHFLNAEEILQDILLSLVSELPPVPLVAETLVRAFPEEEESVRVPLREKYNSLLQRLRQCHVVEEEREEESELMMILIQDKSRQRKKHLRRLRRHMAPRVLHLWEKEEEEEDRGSKHGMAMLRQLSLGTSLSTSTLADYGFPPVCSDGDTGENTSEAISPELPSRATTRDKRAKTVEGKEHRRKKAVKIKSAIQEEIDQSKAKDSQQPSLPVVGTWEFELEDDEYLTFLELFLSYVLEKDSRDGGDSSNEPPLLRDFCSEIRERELHSLTFDVLTTIHRRQRDGHHPARKHSSNDPPVFRAGCCFKPVKRGPTTEPHTSFICSEAPISRSSLSLSSQPPRRTGEQKGLFGLRQRSGVPANQREKENLRGSESIHITEKTSYSFISATSVNMEAVAELQQGLDPKLEAQFPKLGRLLEWMVRWADRRALVGHLGKKNKLAGGVADEGVVIRVKASAPAILTALSLLEDRLTALLGTDRHSAHVQVPPVECIAAPALQPEAERPPERESSVDTGYPGSANTPINAVDHNPQQEEQSDGSCTDDPEELAFHRTSPPIDQDQLTCDAQLRQSDLQQPTFDDLDVTPEKEGTSSRSVGPEVSSLCASENVFADMGTPDMSLKLADLDLTERAQDMSSSPSLCSDAGNISTPPRHGVPAPPSDQPQAATRTEVPGPSETTEPPNVPRSSSTTQAPNQPSDTLTPPVRQNLGEDLFRLIQHINFMGLREVLQASFTNVQLTQQSSTLNILPNVPLSSTPHLIPEPNVSAIHPTIPETPQTKTFVPKPVANDPQSSRPPECVVAHQPAALSSAAHECHTYGAVPPSASGAGVNYQEMKPLSVQAGSPDSPLRRARGLIPSSQGLLATSDTRVQSNNRGPDPSIPQMMGLKTLQLHQPPLSQQGAHYPKPNKHFDQGAPVKRCRDKTGGPSLPRNPLHNVWQTEQPRSQGVSVLPSMLAPHTTAPLQGVRLLKFDPQRPLSNITFPKLPSTTSSRPPTVLEAPMTGTSVIKLLRIELGPKVMLPPTTLPTQMSHLLSLEKLSRSVMGRQSEEESGRHPSNEGSSRPVLSSGLNSSKRQKRREKARQAEVTFRPNDSIIPAQEPADVPEKEEPAAAEEISSVQDVSIPLGHPESILTGQRLLDKAMSTSAELHAFAATCKNPPERHDAFTNTDPDCPPVFVDKAVSAQVSVLASSLKSQGSFQIDNEDPVRDTVRTPHEPESLVDLSGRQFISVLDLEDVRQHQSVPQSPCSAAQEAPAIVPLSPTPAQLHFLATSVIRRGSAAAATADDSQPSVTIPEGPLKPTTHPDNAVETPSVSHNGFRMVSERLASPEERFFVPDPSQSEICRAIKTTSAEPGRAAPSPPTAWFSSHLSELDGQLAALQNIADRLEKDFSDSRMLVNNIEKLAGAEDPDVKTTSTAKKTVRLSVPLKAWEARPDPDPLTEMSFVEEEGENQDEKESHHLRMKDQLPEEEDDLSHTWSDKYLDQAELCDTVEILDELVKEGYLSPTELDLSTLRAVPQSSRPQEQPESSWMLQERVLPEDERRELRMWMRRKQRERLAAYQKQRETLRERERKPFPSSAALQSANRNRKTASRTKEQEKEMLLEQYNQRTHAACSLASKVLTSPGTQRRSLRPDGIPAATTRSTSAPPPGSTQSGPACNKRNLRSQSGQASPHFRAWSADVHDRPSEDHRRRLGLDRPVTILPKDRLSQVTKRGMLTGPKNYEALQPARERGVGQQKKTGLNRTFSRGAAAGRGTLMEQARGEDADTLVGLTEQQGHSSRMDWLAQISGSASSSLSKIDWTAIERMVAEEEEEDEVSQ